MKLKPRDFSVSIQKQKASNEYVYTLSLNTIEEDYEQSFEADKSVEAENSVTFAKVEEKNSIHTESSSDNESVGNAQEGPAELRTSAIHNRSSNASILSSEPLYAESSSPQKLSRKA